MSSILPSIGLFAVLCWPFLVAWLLWVSRRSGNVYNLALAGAVLSVAALILFPSRLDILGKSSIGLASFLPFLLFWPLRHQGTGASQEQARYERLPLLIAGCTLMALSLSSAFLASLFIGAGCVGLAWWDGLSPRRAMAAWSMVRLRLCGVILAVLGAALLESVSSMTALRTGSLWGLIFLVSGLGMMAGLGSLSSQKPAFALLDVGLRFAALCLMVRLGHDPLAQKIMLGAGMIGLVFSATSKSYDEAFLPFLTALATVAASLQSLDAFLLLMLAAIIGTGLWLEGERVKADYSVLPLIFVALLLIGRHLQPLYGGWLIILTGVNCRFLVFEKPVSALSPKACLVPGLMMMIALAALWGMDRTVPIGWHP